MGIQFSEKAPQNSLGRIQSHLSRGQSVQTNTGIRTLQGEPNIRASNGIQIWALGLEDIQSGIADGSRPGEWKFLLFENISEIADAQLSEAQGEEDVSSVSHGPITLGLHNALNIANNMLVVQNFGFEPRLLIVPAITFAALWLHSEETEDLFLPIPPSTTKLPHYIGITREELEQFLRIEAEIIQVEIREKDGPSGGSGRRVHSSSDTAVPLSIPISILNLDAVPNAGTLSPSGGSSGLELPLFMQQQQQSNWCWSAVGTSIGILFSTGNWTQCSTATACLPGTNCCSSPGPCDVYGYLDESLKYTKSYRDMFQGTCTKAEIESEIRNGFPVCSRVAWYGGGAHFMSIAGFDGDYITIQDPIYGRSTMKFTSFASSYQSGGTWTHTYFCQPQS